jgi:hypothetical protein
MKKSTEAIIEECRIQIIYLVDKHNHTLENFKKRIDAYIEEHHPKYVTSISTSAWSKIRRPAHLQKHNNTKSREHWEELEAILLAIRFAYEGELPEDLKKETPKESNGFFYVRYGIFPNQDTILPFYFQETYGSKHYQVDFIFYENWDEGLKALLENEVDVLLHNFPTTIAYSAIIGESDPLFFWPFFNFYGYGIFLKASVFNAFVKERKLNNTAFKYLGAARAELLKSTKILVEKNTDFEWVLYDYLTKKVGLNEDDLKQLHLVNENTNIAKGLFEASDDYGVYITNPIHIYDLIAKTDQSQEKLYDLLAHGINATDHKNTNGLICHKSLFDKHGPVIRDIIDKWFIHTDSFTRKLSKMALKDPLAKTREFTIPKLLEDLNRDTKSNIELHQLANVFAEKSIHFYPDAGDAFKAFYDELLNNDKLLDNYIEIAQLEINSSEADCKPTRDDLLQIIADIKKYMKTIP